MLVLIKENACNLWPKISLKFRKSFEIFKSGYGIDSEILRNIYPCNRVSQEIGSHIEKAETRLE